MVNIRSERAQKLIASPYAGDRPTCHQTGSARPSAYLENSQERRVLPIPAGPTIDTRRARWSREVSRPDLLVDVAGIPTEELQEALDLLRSKRGPDGRWNLEGTSGNLRLESPGRPSKMITFLALRVLGRAGRGR